MNLFLKIMVQIMIQYGNQLNLYELIMEESLTMKYGKNLIINYLQKTVKLHKGCFILMELIGTT